jgi:hypothetical protein
MCQPLEWHWRWLQQHQQPISTHKDELVVLYEVMIDDDDERHTWIGWTHCLASLPNIGIGIDELPPKRTNLARRFKKRSSGPKIGPGRKIVASGNACNTACSPSHLERKYSDGAVDDAPRADTWMKRSTPASLANC